jgi:tetratricopeptide (TPR) repeat protein
MASRLVALAVLLALAGGADAKDRRKAAPTIKELGARPIDVRTDDPVQASAPRAMENYRRFLELQNTDPELRAEALRRLGDLNLEAGELERMEREVTAIDVAGGEAITLYTTLLKAYPDYPRNDQVLYQLARAYETTGQPEQALATLDQVVARYPANPQLDEVQFRRGEILFSAKRYAEAEAAYASVVARGPSSSYYDQGLYKHGWSLFKLADAERGNESFGRLLDSALVDAKAKGGVRRIEDLGRADRELVEDTLRVMSITFSDLDGAETLDRFTAGKGNPPYAHLLYSRLGDLYVEKQRYQDAAATYRAFVARDPINDFAPGLAMQAIEAYRKGGFTDLVLEGKREYVETYGFSRPFWAGRDRAAHAQVVAELKTNLKDVAQYYHATAQGSKKIEDYQQAARWYRDYLSSFPDDPDSAGTNYLLAETLYESRQYLDAAGEYERTAYDYPRNAQSAAAAYAALVSFQKEEERLPEAARSELHERAVDSGVRFATTFPEHPDSAGVLTRAAQDIFAQGDLPRAIEVSETLLARQPPVDSAKQRIGWTIIAQSNFDLLFFDKAEAAYVQARALTAPDDPMRADLTERLAASVYKQAEAKRSSGDALGAVDDFLRVAAVAPDSKIRSTATYDAAAQLVTLKAWDRAIPVLEAFRRDFPQDRLVGEATRSLAVAYSETGRAGEAASEFERIAATATEDPSVRREAVMQAADLYDKAGNATKTVAMLEQFVERYPTPAPEAIEARQRLADAAGKRGDSLRRQYWQREIVQADAAAGTARTDRTRTLAALASLDLAAPARDAFRGIALTAPLKTSLAAKRTSLDKAIQGYRAAADYRISEVTTAATFEMAELYRTLGQDLMKSERPNGLSGEEIEQYDLLLEEQAFPFEEQAIAMHEVNAARAREGVYDASVRKSFAALGTLKPGRYGKTEITQDVVGRIDAGARPAEPVRVDGAAEAGRSTAPPLPLPAPPPPRAIAEYERAVAFARGGDFANAELEFGQLTAAYPDLPGPWLDLGLARRKAGNAAGAVEALERASELAPTSAIAATELGVALRGNGDFAAARAAYERAIAIDPAYAPAHRNLGVVLDLYLSEPAGALAAFERYQSLTGEDKTVNGWIAELRQRVARSGAPAPDAPVAERGAG